jgi:hypothetical protein
MEKKGTEKEDDQLLFAAEYYFDLCEGLISKFNADVQYFSDRNTKDINKSKLFYKIHLESCCFRLAAFIEKNKGIDHRNVYSFLKDNRNKGKWIPSFYFPILIRDTVSHKEDPGHAFYSARKLVLKNITIQEVHEIIIKVMAKCLTRR